MIQSTNSRVLSPNLSSSMFSQNDTFNSSTGSTHKLSSTHIVSTDRIPTDDPSIMSYQRVRKVVTNSFSSVDAELRAKEEHLAHLKSIDVSKYMSPNE